MEPIKFIELATAMHMALHPNEARLRTSIGRSYYGAYHCAIKLLMKLGATATASGRDHGEVCKAIQRCGDSEVSKAGNSLLELGRLRRKADYELSPSKAVETLEAAQDAAAIAREIVSIFDSFENDRERFDRAAQRLATLHC